MFDLRFIRERPDAFDAGLKRRGLEPMAQAILALDARHRAVLTALQEMQSQRNALSKEIGVAKREGRDAQPVMDQVAGLKAKIAESEEQDRAMAAEITELLAGIPNLPAEDVPDGADEEDNVEIRRFGEPQTRNDVKDHADLGDALGMMDFEAAASLSGSRFVLLRGGLARLERALGQFMIDLHTEQHGYTEIAPPLLVRDHCLFGTGQLPKFADDQFQTNSDHWIIPTAEVPLTNLVREQILDADDLPLRFTALTPNFRLEAGAAGKDTRGMIRQHQFTKVELVSVVRPEDSEAEHERMTGAAEAVLKALELPFRTVTLCTGDLGFAAHKTYDLEVWLPGQGRYREISSCSNCGAFQARRMKARYRLGEKAVEPVHTLNGSGVAVGRALIAVIENYQQEDGSIAVPDVLRRYMGGIETIAAA